MVLNSSWPSFFCADCGCSLLRTAVHCLLNQVYLAEWFSTQVAVKVLIVGHVATASDAQRALSLSVPILHKLEAEASLLASLR